jgi:hypothetical protein
MDFATNYFVVRDDRRRQQRCLTTILALNVAHKKGRIVLDAALLI